MDKKFLHLIDSIGDLIPQEREKLGEEDLICECFCVSAGMIRDVCPEQIDLTFLSKKLNLGLGCRDCLKNKEDWIRRIL
jgi:hypothetical protein